ncbi:MAG: hypothetical protein B6U85_03000 [Desulfurococcales archaeon ex4484_42]|nr:MAG: hypothetical protein B6U85_03000 [Desulfurococcales archaeon ex4484_42]
MRYFKGVSTTTLIVIAVIISILIGIGIGYGIASAVVAPTTVTTTVSVPTTETVTTTLAPGATATVTVTETITTTAVQTITTTVAVKPTPKIKEITIGLLEPLTGAHAVFGLEAKQAAELMVDIINNELGGIKSLGGAKLKLVVEDVGETPETGKLAAEKIISQYHPPIVLGAYISRITAGVAEVTNREKVILVMDALVDYLTQKGWKYVFRAAPKASDHGRSAARFVLEMAKKHGLTIKTAVVMNEDSIFGHNVAEGAIEVYFHDGVLIAKAIKGMGFKPMFIAGAGACGYTDPDSIKAAGDAVLWYTNTYSYNPARPTPWNQYIVKKFIERYGKLPTEAGGIIFYSIMVVKEALEKAGEMFPDDPLNPDHLRQAFLALDLEDKFSIAAQLYPTGRIKFNENGDNIYAGTAVLQVQRIGGELKPVVVWPDAEPGVQPIFPRPDWPGAKG